MTTYSRESDMGLDMGTVVGLVTGLLVIGGVGWKLATEMGGIKASLMTFIATFGLKHEALDKEIASLDKRVEKIEDTMRTQG